ncbi:MAG: hypothetical protein IT382_18745 [Deltaproteobacteria bacterium]|nr:hypothetical protein [Deltaproteobacteria bacterium]
MLVKLAPDLAIEDARGCAEAAVQSSSGGLVLTNTTIDPTGLRGAVPEGPGGISGAPLVQRSTEVLRALAVGFSEAPRRSIARSNPLERRRPRPAPRLRQLLRCVASGHRRRGCPRTGPGRARRPHGRRTEGHGRARSRAGWPQGARPRKASAP